MLNQIFSRLKEWAQSGESLDPAKFNDTVAMKTEWTPARGGGTNFRTHKLLKNNSQCLEFKATWFTKLFCGVFFAGGLMFLVFALNGSFKSSGAASVFVVIFPLVFMGVGAVMYYFFTAPIVFDKRRGYYCKGRKTPVKGYSRGQLKNFAALEEIHALQLLREYCRSDKSSYYSYELNLVLKDGRRMNVVDHGNRKQLQEDARMLGVFLGVPVWDAS